MKIFVRLKLIVSSLVYFVLTACSTAPSYKESDHYSEGKFKNRGSDHEPGLMALIKFLVGSGTKWPKSVANKSFDRNYQQPKEDLAQITFINHATFLIQTSKLNILTDPVFSKRASPVQFAGPARVREPGVAMDELPEIHVVLVSHNHYDHMDSESLITLSKKFPKALFLIPLGDSRFFKSWDIKNYKEMDWSESVQLNNTQIFFDESQHWSSRTPFDRKKSLWGSYVIKTDKQQIYFAGDTGYGDHFKRIFKKYGAMDLSLLPIGAYEPRDFMRFHHMNPQDAVKAHQDLNSRQSVAMHFGTFQLTYEGIDQPVKDLKTALTGAHLELEKFQILNEGEQKQF